MGSQMIRQEAKEQEQTRQIKIILFGGKNLCEASGNVSSVLLIKSHFHWLHKLSISHSFGGRIKEREHRLPTEAGQLHL